MTLTDSVSLNNKNFNIEPISDYEICMVFIFCESLPAVQQPDLLATCMSMISNTSVVLPLQDNAVSSLVKTIPEMPEASFYDKTESRKVILLTKLLAGHF